MVEDDWVVVVSVAGGKKVLAWPRMPRRDTYGTSARERASRREREALMTVLLLVVMSSMREYYRGRGDGDGDGDDEKEEREERVWACG